MKIRIALKTFITTILVMLLMKLAHPPPLPPTELQLPKFLRHVKVDMALPEDVWNSLFNAGLIDNKERENLKEVSVVL